MSKECWSHDYYGLDNRAWSCAVSERYYVICQPGPSLNGAITLQWGTEPSRRYYSSTDDLKVDASCWLYGEGTGFRIGRPASPGANVSPLFVSTGSFILAN